MSTINHNEEIESAIVHDFQEQSSDGLSDNRSIDLDSSPTSQRLVFSFAFVLTMISAWHNLILTFMAPPVDHWCVGHHDLNVKGQNWINSNDSLEQRHDGASPDQCHFLGNNNSEEKVECNKWMFDSSFYSSTIVSEWNLVCDSEWLISLSQSIFMAGFVASMLSFSQLSDRFGRKPVILAALLVFLVSGFGCLASNSYTVFTVMRFFVSLGISGAGSTMFILLMEIADARSRSFYGIGYQLGWAFGFVLLPGLAWLIRDWHHLHLAIMLPSVSFLVFWWFIPESQRWLLSNGSYEKLLSSMSTKNDIRSKEKILQIITETKDSLLEDKRLKRATFFDLIRMPNMRKKTINLFFCWFVNAFIYYGLSLNTNDLGGNVFLNFFISGLVEFPAYIASTIAIHKLGRRIPQMATMVVGGAACLFTIPLTGGTLWLRITLAMTGKFCITSSFAILYVFSAETYPTVVRNAGMGFSSVFARIGSMVAPFVKELGHATHTSVPFAVFGGMSIISGLLVLLLPETRKLTLPNTVSEGEKVQRSTALQKL